MSTYTNTRDVEQCQHSQIGLDENSKAYSRIGATTIGSETTESLESTLTIKRSKGKKSRLRDWYDWWNYKTLGWRVGVIACAACSTTAFILNLTVTIWVARASYNEDGSSVLFDGQCSKANTLNTWLHFLINVLSTFLLSSSNYCMQYLSAPTRRDVDKAHAQRTYLDIGVPSIRNLRYIKKPRVIFWLMLCLSSLPIHLFYNSTIFSSITAQEYEVLAVTPNFLDPWVDEADLKWPRQINTTYRRYYQSQRSEFERLDVPACIDAYAKGFVSDRSMLLMRSSDLSEATGNTSVLHYYAAQTLHRQEQFRWICEETTSIPYTRESVMMSIPYSGPSDPICRDNIEQIKANAADWRPFGTRIDECYSQKIQERCKVMFSVELAIVVVSLNALKAGIMIVIALNVEDPLASVGDAISSFLSKEDIHTAGVCLATRTMDMAQLITKDLTPQAAKYDHAKRWHTSTSKKRYFICIGLVVAAMATISPLLSLGLSNVVGPKDVVSLGKLGIGEINQYAMIGWTLASKGRAGLISNVLVANLPQPVLSCIYFSINGLFTNFFLGVEWNSYSHGPAKGVRVTSKPVGSQRESYFLQLPYRVALPLMALSGVIHWLVSQSIFLVSTVTYRKFLTGSFPDLVQTEMTCGYSPLAIILVLVFSGLMIILIVVLGSLKYKTGMPIAGSNSLAIAAACHQLGSQRDPDAGKKPLRWGVSAPGHCSFSSGEVTSPVLGEVYQ